LALRVFLRLIPITIAIIITLISGLFILTQNSFYYGFPFGWRLGPYCPIQNIFGCAAYNWGAFILDVFFYAAVGYGLILGYAKYRAGKPAGLMPTQN
jgi:hypothetical protein